MVETEIDLEILGLQPGEYVTFFEVFLSFFPVSFVTCIDCRIENQNEYGEIYDFHGIVCLKLQLAIG